MVHAHVHGVLKVHVHGTCMFHGDAHVWLQFLMYVNGHMCSYISYMYACECISTEIMLSLKYTVI